jgi:hypothetical protein
VAVSETAASVPSMTAVEVNVCMRSWFASRVPTAWSPNFVVVREGNAHVDRIAAPAVTEML